MPVRVRLTGAMNFGRVTVWTAIVLLAGAVAGGAQSRKQQQAAAGYDRAARATVLHAANVYVSADAGAQRISLVNPGHEVVVVERNGRRNGG